MNTERNPSYFAYWGKAHPQGPSLGRYHLLPYHCLDVAACGQRLLGVPRFSLKRLSSELGWPVAYLEDLCVAFLAVHDIGKFAASFQGVARDLGPALIAGDSRGLIKHRHDTLGWVACSHLITSLLGPSLDWYGHSFLLQMARIFTGHHGKPPMQLERSSGEQIRIKNCFSSEDLAAAEAYVREVVRLFIRAPLPPVTDEHLETLKRYSWTLAGLAVLADWLGSDSERFFYHEQVKELSEYWSTVAIPAAKESITDAGLGEQQASVWAGAKAYLPSIAELTPLQQYAASVSIGTGPQFFLLEDVTGAGKTEAALLLCHRLMSGGYAVGFYFALPTMATANQMYRRVGKLYRGMFSADAAPSLVLAHGAREMVEGFRESVLQPMPMNDSDDVLLVGAQCNAWIADSRKKALLADAGVGTIDQALLGVLPVRHQSLRLLGLASKVLVVDEVHAYDDYTSGLLTALVRAQAGQGGSVVLLSATVPASLRAALVAAFQQGLGGTSAGGPEADARYPLVTHANAAGVQSEACETRPQMVRSVRVQTFSDEDEAEARMVCWTGEGKAVCWVRNTVEDARRAFTRLQAKIDAMHLSLFHSQFVMKDRLDIEAQVLTRFGSESTPAQRCGQMLVATQVVEQSLDLDFDEMIVDLAPVDLIIQRAGRLHRHLREARSSPVLHVLAPAFTADPRADWYSAVFPKAAYVYDDHGKLWLTLRALLQSGTIETPGELGQANSVRSLVEAVYGNAAQPTPTGLWSATRDAAGRRRAESSLANLNVLQLGVGYCIDAGDWDVETRKPTRLGDEGRLIYLAREQDGCLVPLLDSPRYGWEHTSIRIDQRRIDSLEPKWQTKFAGAIATLQGAESLLAEDAGGLILPLVAEDGGWTGWCQSKGEIKQARYDSQLGFVI
jgi:CRISPR-associated endonuclease/helicase Cas3